MPKDRQIVEKILKDRRRERLGKCQKTKAEVIPKERFREKLRK
jgi:hypothetical protein